MSNQIRFDSDGQVMLLSSLDFADSFVFFAFIWMYYSEVLHSSFHIQLHERFPKSHLIFIIVFSGYVNHEFDTVLAVGESR